MFSCDGKSDLVWRETGGMTATWMMDGATVSAVASLGYIAPNWTLQAANSN